MGNHDTGDRHSVYTVYIQGFSLAATNGKQGAIRKGRGTESLHGETGTADFLLRPTLFDGQTQGREFLA